MTYFLRGIYDKYSGNKDSKMSSINFYNKFKLYMVDGTINLSSHNIKIALMTSNHSFVPTHSDFSQVIMNQLTAGNGYSNGGKLLVNTTVFETGGQVTFDADNVTWTASGGPLGPAAHAVIYDDTAPDDKLVCSIDFGGNQTAGEGTEFKITFNASGILRVS